MLLKTYLRKFGIRQQDFAAALTACLDPEKAVTQGAISKMVHGMYRPRPRIRAAIRVVTRGCVSERDWRRARSSRSGA